MVRERADARVGVLGVDELREPVHGGLARLVRTPAGSRADRANRAATTRQRESRRVVAETHEVQMMVASDAMLRSCRRLRSACVGR
jgi:hypothetical protein